MSDFKSKMKSNVYNTKQLDLDNEEYGKNISDNRISIKTKGKELKSVDSKISESKDKKDDLLGKRYSIEQKRGGTYSMVNR